MQTISKSRFKPQALKYFREIQKSGKELVITDRGKPVLKILPCQDDPQAVLEELRNSVVKFNDPFEPVALQDWDILK